jgi:hypothetical protein
MEKKDKVEAEEKERRLTSTTLELLQPERDGHLARLTFLREARHGHGLEVGVGAGSGYVRVSTLENPTPGRGGVGGA